MRPIHFSTLKKMALSPAHYRACEAEPFEATRAMRLGTIAHHIVLGPSNVKPLVRWRDGERKGSAWKAFAEANDGAEIVTDTEWEEAEPMAAAVMANEHARRLIEGSRTEVPMSWTSGGIPCATRGMDVVGPRHMADLKFTSCAEPAAFMRHATKLLYPQQMGFYQEGCEQNRIDVSGGIFLIAVESKVPYPVTVLRMTDPVLAHGRKSIALWIERLRSCLESDFWPGYTQAVLDFELPAWMDDGSDE